MRIALNEITIDPEQNVKLKSYSDLNSPLLRKRLKKSTELTHISSSMVSFKLETNRQTIDRNNSLTETLLNQNS